MSYSVSVKELNVNGKEVEVVDLIDKLSINLKSNMVKTNIVYFTGNVEKAFFGLFNIRTKKELTPIESSFNEWEINYKLDDDHATTKIKNMGVAGAVGFAVAGPAGAAAGAWVANGKDVPVILKNKNRGILIKGKAKSSLIKILQERDFFDANE